MQNFIIYSNLIIGVWLIIMALAIQTKNFRSALVFKIIPFFGGCSLIFNALKMLSIV